MAAPTRSSPWTEEAYKSLCVAFTLAITENGGSVHAYKDYIVKVMADHGHTFTWDAIR
jgi:hypothetical protein